MLILLAESKGMNTKGEIVEAVSMPMFQSQAEEIVSTLRKKSVAELESELKLGPKNAQRLFENLYDFPVNSHGLLAIDAFDGVVFKALDASSLGYEARQKFHSSVRIVSSLYGILRPDDVIKPYRLDFGMKAAPNGETLSAYWQGMLTDYLISLLKEKGEQEVLNLLPKDAAKCFDWKKIEKNAEVYIAEFKEFKSGDCPKSPHSNRLKQLRGLLLREILIKGLDTVSDISRIDNNELSFDAVASKDKNLVFITC